MYFLYLYGKIDGIVSDFQTRSMFNLSSSFSHCQNKFPALWFYICGTITYSFPPFRIFWRQWTTSLISRISENHIYSLLQIEFLFMRMMKILSDHFKRFKRHEIDKYAYFTMAPDLTFHLWGIRVAVHWTLYMLLLDFDHV
jgi:hypothetical protein